MMVMVTWSMLCLASSSTQSGRARPLVDTHSLMSGASALSRRKVSKVRWGLASGSPGPAMPSTLICGMLAATALTFFTAWSGVSTSETTPGRDSLAQSYLRLQ
ncbi:hypothetical protein D3C86_1669040 [compost metagenome]